MTATPKPSIEEMADRACDAFIEFSYQPNGMHDPSGAWDTAIEAALAAAARAGWVLVPVELLNEAADQIDGFVLDLDGYDNRVSKVPDPVATDLREYTKGATP